MTPEECHYKCMWKYCTSRAMPDQPVCRVHFNFELALVIIVGFLGVGGIIWFSNAFTVHMNTRGAL